MSLQIINSYYIYNSDFCRLWFYSGSSSCFSFSARLCDPMLHYCYLFLFLLLGWRETTAAAPPNGSDELARHACTLDRNDTLQSVFLEDVISRYNLSLRQDQTSKNDYNDLLTVPS